MLRNQDYKPELQQKLLETKRAGHLIMDNMKLNKDDHACPSCCYTMKRLWKIFKEITQTSSISTPPKILTWAYHLTASADFNQCVFPMVVWTEYPPLIQTSQVDTRHRKIQFSKVFLSTIKQTPSQGHHVPIGMMDS